MKRVLVVLTTLTALSNATVLELSVNGVTNGDYADQAISLAPSGTVMIDVYCSANANYSNWVIVYNHGHGSFAPLGTIYAPPSPPGTMYSYYYHFEYIWFETTVSTVPAQTGKWWDVEFTCDGTGTVTISLISGEDYVTVEDTITITQIPEPLTVALLGLGGLFLRRRR